MDWRGDVRLVPTPSPRFPVTLRALAVAFAALHMIQTSCRFMSDACWHVNDRGVGGWAGPVAIDRRALDALGFVW
jgi:hypothetical protein